MTKDEARTCFRDYVQYGGCIQTSNHCRDRMLERNINMDDMLNVLHWGEIETIEYDENHDSWKCKLKGKDIDGNELIFLTALYEPCHTVKCVTVF